MDTSTSLDPRARRWGKVALYTTLTLGLGFAVAPFIWTALSGLAGLIVGAGILLATWIIAPVAENVAANLRLKLIKAEAARNPVESLQVEHLRQSERLDRRKMGIEQMSGAIRTLAETIAKLEREFPESPELKQMKADQAELVGLLNQRNADWQDAYVSLGMFAKEIQRAGRIWEVAQAAAKARQQSGLTEEEWMAELRTKTSLDAIRTNLNTQLAALSTEKMQADADRLLKGKLDAKAVPRNMVDSTVSAPVRTASTRAPITS